MKKRKKQLPEIKEDTVKWADLDEDRKVMTLATTLKTLNISPILTGTLILIFDTDNPTMIFDAKNKYCRMDTESITSFSALAKKYL